MLLLDTHLILTNELVRYVTTNLKHTLSVFESVMSPPFQPSVLESFRCLRDHCFLDLKKTIHVCVAHTIKMNQLASY